MFPILPYGVFTRFTPTVPDFYRNIYSQEEGIKKILFELCKLSAYANEIADGLNELDGDYSQLAGRVQELSKRIDAVSALLDGLKLGGRSRNPVTGAFDYLYVTFKQIWDTLRIHSMTWRQLASSGHTWAELAGDGKTYIEVDMLANDIWGDGTEQIKYTNPANIDIHTPGYIEEV